MKWQIKYMVDPGDGIESTAEIEHPSDDIGEVAADVFNGDTEWGRHEYWIFGLEALPS